MSGTMTNSNFRLGALVSGLHRNPLRQGKKNRLNLNFFNITQYKNVRRVKLCCC